MIWIWGHSKWQTKDVLQKKWRCAFVPFVFVCVSYILCSGMWNIDLKKKKNPTYLPYFFFYVTPIKQFPFLRLSVCTDMLYYHLVDMNIFNLIDRTVVLVSSLKILSTVFAKQKRVRHGVHVCDVYIYISESHVQVNPNRIIWLHIKINK